MPDPKPARQTDVPISVAIVDDDDSFRRKIESWLRTNPRFQCADSCASGESGLNQICSKPPAVAVIEFGLRGRKGDEVIRRLKLRAPSVKIVVITGMPGSQVVLEALDAGADGFLDRDGLTRRELFRQLDRLVAGGHPLSERARNLLLEEHLKGRPYPESIGLLTPREREVAERKCRGLSSEAIARELGVSVWTVRAHERNLYSKLHVHNRAGLQSTIYGIRKPNR